MSNKLKKPIIFKTAFSVYTADEIIGEGGSGKVYSCKDESEKTWAIKILNSNKISQEKLKRFKNEYYFCSRNQHKNILTVMDHGLLQDSNKSIPFYVMPKYDYSLRKLISQGIESDNILKYFSQILDGAEAAHLKEVTHRDLKPENILYNTKNNNLVIADFGIAHFSEDELYTIIETNPQTRLANFQYAAPEQRKKGDIIDHKADIFALGLILNEMFTGEIPQGTKYKTIKSIREEYGYLDSIVENMIRQKPNDRTATINDVKCLLMTRKNEFISQQKLSKLKNIVIPKSEVDDPLIENPVKLIKFDWKKNVLSLELNNKVNEKWKDAFKNMREYYYSPGETPAHIGFFDDIAKIRVEYNRVQNVIDYFKDWLITANKIYEKRIRKENEEAIENEKKRLKKEIHEEEIRQNLLKNIKI